MGISARMRVVLALAAVAIALVAINEVESVAEVVDLGSTNTVSSAEDCDSVRESMGAMCKMFGEAKCTEMKAKMEAQCPPERTTELLETAEEPAMMEDDDHSPKESLGDSAWEGAGQGRRGGGALMTSGSFNMMFAGGANNRAGNGEEDQDLGESDDEDERAEDWDISKAGKCNREQAWQQMDATDADSGKCVDFASDDKCGAKCFHKGNAVEETESEAICSKICRVAGANGAQCNVIKTVQPIKGNTELGEGKTMYLTKSKVMQAGLKDEDLASADPMACAGVATNRRA